MRQAQVQLSTGVIGAHSHLVDVEAVYFLLGRDANALNTILQAEEEQGQPEDEGGTRNCAYRLGEELSRIPEEQTPHGTIHTIQAAAVSTVGKETNSENPP